MERFCDFITNPAWWSVIATFVAAIVAACITSKFSKRQSELQEQQNAIQVTQSRLLAEQVRQQDYEIYRRMYTRIDNIDVAALSYLHILASCLYHMVDKDGRLSTINEILKENEVLNKEFTECTFDIELKQCGNIKDVHYYYGVLSEMKEITMVIKYLVDSNQASFAEYFTDYQIDETTSSTKLIEIIVNFCKNSDYRNALESRLVQYVKLIEASKTSPLKTIVKNRIIPAEAK